MDAIGRAAEQEVLEPAFVAQVLAGARRVVAFRGGGVAGGAGLARACGLVRALAPGHIRKSDKLATAVPYAHTRNPLYFGSFLIACGFAIAAHWARRYPSP